MRQSTFSLAVPLVVAALLGVSWASAQDDDGAKARPLAATWEYSLDGGNTFEAQPPTIEATRTPEERFRVVARCKFAIDDLAKIGLLKLISGEGVDGGLTLTSAESVDRYNVGARPTLTKTQLVLNGAPTDAGHAPNVLYRYFGIDPAQLKKGENTLQVSGNFWFQSAPSRPGVLRFETLPADHVTFDRPPALGAIGEDFFSLTARTVIPAEFTVAVTPLEPAGPEQTHAFPCAKELKARVALPKGVKKFRYVLTGSAGGGKKQVGPFEVDMPKFGEGFRFAVAGGMNAYKAGSEPVKKLTAKLLDAKPQMLVLTGYYQNCSNWDFGWNQVFFRDMKDVLAHVPLMPMAGFEGDVSPVAFHRQFYFPPNDENYARWTHVMGPIRFVAIDVFQMMDEKNGESLKWLGDVLAGSKEPYVIVLNAHVTHGSGLNTSRRFRPGLEYVKKNVNPLLVTHDVTAVIGSSHQSYERIEPPAGEGVRSIISARTASMGKPFHAGYADANKASRASSGGDHFCLFELKNGSLELKAFDLDGKKIDEAVFAPRK